MLRCVVAAVVLLASSCLGADVPGALGLDSFTFDKFVGSPHFDVLVKFDKQYPYGDKEDAFKEFSKRVGELKAEDVLITSVGVQDYGDKQNDDLRERFGIKADDFPVYRLFKKGSKEAINYGGEVTADGLTRFLKSEIGLYVGLPGCLEAFDKLAAGYLGLEAGKQGAVVKEAEAAAKGLEGEKAESAKFYINVMKKVQEKGSSYTEKETARLEKLVGSKVSEDKKKAMKAKLNILPSFTA